MLFQPERSEVLTRRTLRDFWEPPRTKLEICTNMHMRITA